MVKTSQKIVENPGKKATIKKIFLKCPTIFNFEQFQIFSFELMIFSG